MGNSHRRAWILVSLALMALVALRSAFPLFWGYVNFDSDESIIGMMARDLADGHAFPLLFYGQKYMLGVESWFLAPFVKIFGDSVTSLRAPLVLMTLATTVLLARILARDSKHSPLETFALTSLFALPGLLTSRYLLQAVGANAEILLYYLLLWTFRRAHPLLLGLFLGVGALHRELILFALPGLALERVKSTRKEWFRDLAMIVGVLLITIGSFRLYIHLHPEFIGPRAPISHLGSRLTRALSFIPTTGLPFIYGFADPGLSHQAIGAEMLPAAPRWSSAMALAGFMTIALLGTWGIIRGARNPFAQFLVMTSLAALGGFAFASPNVDVQASRYLLPACLLPIGLASWGIQSRISRQLVITGVSAILATHLLQHSSLIMEAMKHPPQDRVAALISKLQSRGLSHGYAGYWESYLLTYRSRGQLKVTPIAGDWMRIPSLQAEVDQHLKRVFSLTRQPQCETPEALENLWLCDSKNSKGAP